MGLIRKAISGTAAVATGGLSLGVIQFRSDQERNTRQVKKLGQKIERQAAGLGAGDDFGFDPGQGRELQSPQPAAGFARPAAVQNFAVVLPDAPPADTKLGWKIDPDAAGMERFWNGRSWTSKTRSISQ